MIRVILSESEKSIDSILLWHQRAANALHARLLDEQSGSTALAVFFTMTDQEVQEFFSELDYLSMLDLLSATEAALRVNFWERIQNKKKDALSRDFRKLAKSQGKKISLGRHILRLWVEQNPKLKSRVAQFHGVLKLRDWLAHGRYWTPRFGRLNYSPSDVFEICDGLLRKMSIR